MDILADTGVSKLSAKDLFLFFLKWTTPLSMRREGKLQSNGFESEQSRLTLKEGPEPEPSLDTRLLQRVGNSMVSFDNHLQTNSNIQATT